MVNYRKDEKQIIGVTRKDGNTEPRNWRQGTDVRKSQGGFTKQPALDGEYGH